MRNYETRLNRLEDAIREVASGHVIERWLVGASDGRPIPGEEPCTATCEGVTLRRTASETVGEFMTRVREAFPEIPGKCRCVHIDQSIPPAIQRARQTGDESKHWPMNT